MDKKKPKANHPREPVAREDLVKCQSTLWALNGTLKELHLDLRELIIAIREAMERVQA